MRIKVSKDAKVTLPVEVLEALGIKPGEYLEIDEDDGVYVLHTKRLDFSGFSYLHDKIPADAPPFDIRTFRDKWYGRSPGR